MRTVLAWASPAAFIVALVIVAAIPVVAIRQRRVGLARAIRSTALDAAVVASLAVVLVLTVALEDGDVETRVHLIPFRQLLSAIAAGDRPLTREAVVDIVLNLVLFVPLGAAIALRAPWLRWRTFLIAVSVFAVTIEAMQAAVLTGRTADSTDVLTNVTGGFLAFSATLAARNLVIARGSPRSAEGRAG